MNKYSSYVLYLLISFLVVILYANDFGPLNSLQRSLNDMLCRLTASDAVRPNVVLATIDGRAQDEYGNWPWDRDLIADLLAAVASGEPKAIAVNFELSEDASQDSAGYTSILAGQLTWIDNVVIPYDIALATFRSGKTSNPEHLFNNSITVDNPLGIMEEGSSLLARKLFLPAEKLLDSKPYLGFTYTMPDDDRIVRRQPLLMNYEGYYYPSMSLLAAAVYFGLSPDQIKVVEGKEILLGGERRIPINDRSEIFVSFPRGNVLPTYSAAQILGENFDFNRLKNKLVVIGVDDFAYRETFYTPVQSEMTRLAIQATIMENIVNDNFLVPKDDQPILIMLILLLIGGLCAISLPQVSLLHRIVILTVGFIILANVNYFLFSSFRMIPETNYIALELALILAASPLLDSQLLGARAEGGADKRQKLPKIEVEPEIGAREKPVVIRQIRSSVTDPENQQTAAFEEASALPPEDHQAISIDEETDTTTATPQTGSSVAKEKSVFEAEQSASQPETIVPADHDPPETSRASEPEVVPPTEESQPVRVLQQPADLHHLGRYQITGTLGKGAMGLVYKGVDPAINRPVALKTIRLDFVNDPQEEAELKERLHREAQAAGKLSHPNIVTIYDVGSEGHLQYIAMEYLEGQTLEDLIKKKVQFNYRIIAQIILQICSALEYAHDQGIVHRDIKPANVMILKDYRIKVMDYGIARIDSSSMTKTGIAMGTPNYISPEQLKGQPTDQRADIFSLGVLMYEMLLGRRPFKGGNITSLIYAVLNHEPEKPSHVNPQLPLLFDHIIDKALKKEPKERYQKAREVAADLADFVESFAPKA